MTLQQHLLPKVRYMNKKRCDFTTCVFSNSLDHLLVGNSKQSASMQQSSKDCKLWVCVNHCSGAYTHDTYSTCNNPTSASTTIEPWEGRYCNQRGQKRKGSKCRSRKLEVLSFDHYNINQCRQWSKRVAWNYTSSNSKMLTKIRKRQHLAVGTVSKALTSHLVSIEKERCARAEFKIAWRIRLLQNYSILIHFENVFRLPNSKQRETYRQHKPTFMYAIELPWQVVMYACTCCHLRVCTVMDTNANKLFGFLIQ